MGYDIPGQLFTLLAQAKSQPQGWSKDLTAATGAANSVMDAYKGYKAQTTQNKLDSFFDSSVPNDALQRIVPGAPSDGSVTFRDLGALSQSGLTGVLKDPNSNVDLKTLSVLGSGGDPDKASKLYQMFSGNTPANADGTPGTPAPLKLNPATLAAAKALHQPTPKAARAAANPSMAPEVNTLKSLQQQYSKQLSGDISEGDRARVQRNLDAVNARLGRIGGVTIDNTPAPAAATAPAAVKPAAPAAAPSSTSGAIQALLKALTS
jgi:hypothetical protein